MRNFLSNIGYFLREVKTIIRTSLMSNIISIFSTGLIFFILAIVISGFLVSSRVVEAIQKDAEVSVYFDESIGENGTQQLIDKLKGIDGILDVKLVGKDEAYTRMEDILGKDAEVLKYFDDNPFSPFLEVKIDLQKMEPILNNINSAAGVSFVRDNSDVLNRIRELSNALRLLGYLIILAVGISTLVIIAHIIRMGIHNNREQINTLKLLGAPDAFISFPFLLQGLLLTLSGGILAAILSAAGINYVYSKISGPLPFIPLPSIGELVSNLVVFLLCLSALLGIVGSYFGLSSSKKIR